MKWRRMCRLKELRNNRSTNMKLELLQSILYSLARATLKKYQPRCIGVTGSVGKSSTKTAIALVLSARHRVGADAKSYNTPIGLPLAILGEEGQGRNIFGWLGVICRALKRLIKTDLHYPQVLVLEMGVDTVGDMAYLVSLAPCAVGVVTVVTSAHLALLGSIENTLQEKMTLVRTLAGERRCAILNADDELIMRERNSLKDPVITFGFTELADLRVQKLIFARS